MTKHLILELAKSLHASGSPAYELDDRMELVAAALEQPATFFSTPTALFATFDDEPQGTRLLRVYPGDTNLGMYAELYALQQSILDRSITVEEAWSQLQEIRSLPNSYSSAFQLTSYGIAGGCVAVLVGGNATVVVSASVVGLIVGALVLGLSYLKYPTHLINVIAGFVSGTVTCAVQVWLAPGNYELTALSALIVLVPGLHLTISINELATHNLASGSARIAGAMTTLLTLVFGVYMGSGFIAGLQPIPASVAPQTPSLLASAGVMIPVGLSFAVLFRTRYRDILWLLISTLIGYGTLRIVGEFLRPFAAVSIASVVAGVTSRLLSQRLQLPAAVMLMPALILLVPGSLGFTGVAHFMLHEDIPAGVRLLSTMFLTAVAIVAGQLVSDVIFPPHDRYDKRNLSTDVKTMEHQSTRKKP
ncbi:threonine/serine exporter family protein [Thalassoroseus pseudoceratinae]|uniref:threonine/serine ThrE exporter family protein n=1 Tax=Thalassoroseus pseudoceratinae TaxID=2713176 RepID=UPI0019801A7A|nr:threonine/serine exporter family protein [Thalassoroseus pseudoceratinae]